jgi:transketolase
MELLVAAEERDLVRIGIEVRREILLIAHAARACHLGSCFSIVDILVVLYWRFLRVDPDKASDPARDRFILSKGHAFLALSVVLAKRKFISEEGLRSGFSRNGSMFPGHPSSMMVPGVELSTGSLGHGLSVAVGMALSAKLCEQSFYVVALLSDGECDEGSVWEAALSASHWKLRQLVAVIDYNKIQSFGRVEEVMGLEPFAAKWKAFGWSVVEVDGHSYVELAKAMGGARDQSRTGPLVIIAHTVKGKGVSFMENTVEWHYLNPSTEQLALAMDVELKCKFQEDLG